MLADRFRNDGKAIYPMTKNQTRGKKELEKKIESSHYKMIQIPCIVCKKEDFDVLAEKDRYGIFMSVVICKNCGLVQTNPKLTEENYHEFYDSEYRQIYEEGGKVTEKFFRNEYTKGKMITNFVKKTTNQSFGGQFVAEIGCGSGGTMKYFQDNDSKAIGFDLGSEFLKFGREKGADLRVGTINDLMKIKEKPKLIIYSHVLEHIFNPIEELKRIAEYIDENTYVYIEVPGIKHLDLTYHQNFLEFLQNAHLHHFSLTSLNNCAKQAGLELVHGNEIISTLFKKSKTGPTTTYENDFESTLTLLKNVEEIRNKTFSYKRIKSKLFAIAYRILLKTNTRQYIQPIYHRYKLSK